jgi:hypothetical protein
MHAAFYEMELSKKLCEWSFLSLARSFYIPLIELLGHFIVLFGKSN